MFEEEVESSEVEEVIVGSFNLTLDKDLMIS